MLDDNQDWDSWETPIYARLYYEYARTGVCHCGSDMDGHGEGDNHSPVEMIYPL